VSDASGFSYQRTKASLLRHSQRPVLQCDAISLLQLAERFGTPLYVYSASAIRTRTQLFHNAFGEFPHTLCYSVKANSNLSILRLLSKQGCGFDIVSGGELARVLAVDRHLARSTVFSGVGKTAQEMVEALHANILLFNVESESELFVLAQCAAEARGMPRIAVRVNPDVPAKTHPYISTGLHQHKFGVPISDARKLYAKAASMKKLQVAGVSVHIGSQILDTKPFALAIDRVGDLVRELRADGHKIEYVDAGGGLGINYEKSGKNAFTENVRAYARALTRGLNGLGVHLLLEPGRSVVGPAGVLLTRVLYRKQNNGRKFVVVDAAMNDMLRPSLYDAYHEIVPIVKEKNVTMVKVDVVGPICETGDFFARDRTLPQVAEDDLLAICDVGAYGMALASNYNSRPRAAEVLVDGRSVKVIRRRETVADLMRPEKL
jgi:diaminopimelate decarboxylase